MSNKLFIISQVFIITAFIVVGAIFGMSIKHTNYLKAAYGENKVETIYAYNDALYVQNEDEDAENKYEDVETLYLTSDDNTVILANATGDKEANVMITIRDEDGNMLYSSNSLTPSESTIWDAGEEIYNSDTNTVQISVFNEDTNKKSSSTVSVVRV